jgi:hypothetical protein
MDRITCGFFDVRRVGRPFGRNADEGVSFVSVAETGQRVRRFIERFLSRSPSNKRSTANV